MKATLLIRKEHERIRALLERYQRAGERNGSQKRQLVRQIERAVNIYSDLETQILYPEVRHVVSATADEFIAGAEVELEAIAGMLAVVSGSLDEVQVESMMTELAERLGRHMDLEELQLLDEMRAGLTEQRLEELGLEVEHRRQLLTQLAA